MDNIKTKTLDWYQIAYLRLDQRNGGSFVLGLGDDKRLSNTALWWYVIPFNGNWWTLIKTINYIQATLKGHSNILGVPNIFLWKQSYLQVRFVIPAPGLLARLLFKMLEKVLELGVPRGNHELYFTLDNLRD